MPSPAHSHDRLHKGICHAVVRALDEIFGGGKYADKVIEKVLKMDSRWGSRDRRFIAESTYGIVRWYRFLVETSGVQSNDYWSLLGWWLAYNHYQLPPWQEFSSINVSEWTERAAKLSKIRRIRESIPDWLDTLGEQELGADWDKELHALNEEAQVVLRTNTLKIPRKDLMKLLQDEGTATEIVPEVPDALTLVQRKNVFQSPLFKEGLFEIQDAGSQLIAPFLRVESGMRVIDGCSGAGGKTLHLSALMRNKGRILAMDTEAWKLEELKKRSRRAGASNIETRTIDSSKVIKRLEKSADRVLLDVPCSGLGVLKRNPDAKWKLELEFMARVRQTQQQILTDYSKMVRPGGGLVYSTCSLLPSENERQIATFIESHPDFSLVEDRTIRPSEGFDGFYMAYLERK